MSLPRILTSRPALCAADLLLAVLTVAGLVEAAGLLGNGVDDFSRVEAILDGIGVIFVSYGVALEERETLMRFFKLYPGLQTPLEEAVDRLCHHYGLFILLMGLLMEVAAEVVQIPNRLFGFPRVEELVFSLGLLSGVFACGLLLRHAWLLRGLSGEVVSEQDA